MALLLLQARRPADAGTRDLQMCVGWNFLALQRKGSIMKRAGTIIQNARM
jgi:hypothetical protein